MNTQFFITSNRQSFNQSQIQPLALNQLLSKHQIQNQHEFQTQNQSSNTKIQHSHEFIQLDKIYKNKNKFNETNDNFNFKFNIFINKCNRIDFFMKT